MHLLKAAEAGIFAETADRLFEIYLSHILDDLPSCRAEILMFTSQDILVPVAFAEWKGPEGDQVKRIRVESWVLENPTPVITCRIRFVPMRPFFSVPLLGSGKILGFLNSSSR